VLEQNAHAWPEVFFPKYGWVEFEPTASEAPLVRPVRAVSGDNTDSTDPNVDEGFENQRDNLDDLIPPEDLAGPVALTPSNRLLAGADAAGPPWSSAQRRWWPGAGRVLGAGGRRRQNLVGWAPGSCSAPAARCLRRGAGLASPSVARWLGSITTPPLPTSAPPPSPRPCLNPGLAAALTHEYVTEQYSPRPADPAAAQHAWYGSMVSGDTRAPTCSRPESAGTAREKRKRKLAGAALGLFLAAPESFGPPTRPRNILEAPCVHPTDHQLSTV
jgi:hypothetical protein